MQASETVLKALLEGKRQYLVPLYQRRYAWSGKNWKPFWEAIERQYWAQKPSPEKKPTHFFGSLVLQPQESQVSGVWLHSVIDGQQRLTTIFVLLAALRDSWADVEQSQRIQETYLVNKWNKKDAYFKLISGEHDRADLEAVLGGSPEKAVGSIGSAYRWLLNKIELLRAKDPELDFEKIELAAVERLEIAGITLQAGDNAHRIFQTLNSTGEGLTQVDLLRNHFFMLLPSAADDIYRDLWQPMERRLGSHFETFLWVETVSRGLGREAVPRERVYEQWQVDLGDIEHDEVQVHAELERLAGVSEAFALMVRPELLPETEVRSAVERLLAWGTAVHYPVTLQAMTRFVAGELSASNVVDILGYVESYLVRRMLVGRPTNNLNRIFTTAAGQIAGRLDLRDAVHRVLSVRTKYWPSDRELLAGVHVAPFYETQQARQRQFVLRRLEEAVAGGEVPDWGKAEYQVEHVMPQHLTQEWIQELAESGEQDPIEAHRALVHALGNLTLTTKNPELSDHPLTRKQDILKNSFLTLNQQIASTSGWNREVMATRATSLAGIAIALWPEPLPGIEDDESWQSQLDGILRFLPDGVWIARSELGEHLGVSAEHLRSYLNKSGVTGAERVLNDDGSLDLGSPAAKNDLRALKGRLVAAGILESLDEATAPMSLRQSLAELSDES